MQNETTVKEPHVVIIGAGFGGIRTARSLGGKGDSLLLLFYF